jgi:hypothetical protein
VQVGPGTNAAWLFRPVAFLSCFLVFEAAPVAELGRHAWEHWRPVMAVAGRLKHARPAKADKHGQPTSDSPSGRAGRAEVASACQFSFNHTRRRKKAKHADRLNTGSTQTIAVVGGRPWASPGSRPQRAVGERSPKGRRSKATRARRAGRRAGQGTGLPTAAHRRRVNNKSVFRPLWMRGPARYTQADES